jgi:hypothetical protein
MKFALSDIIKMMFDCCFSELSYRVISWIMGTAKAALSYEGEAYRSTVLEGQYSVQFIRPIVA